MVDERLIGEAKSRMEKAMPQVSYKIERDGEMWSLLRNGEPEMSYVTQEAAFEAASADASADLRSGFDIVIQAASPTDPAGASRESGGRPMKGDGFS
jgi:hypothetical protein